MSTSNPADPMTAAAVSSIPTREITVGILAVVTDYAGREIGVRVTHIHGDESFTGRHIGLTATAPYMLGDCVTRDRKYVRPAI